MSRAHDLNSSALPTGTENGQGSVSASQLQSQPWMKWSQLEALSGLELFGTTLVGIKKGVQRVERVASEDDVEELGRDHHPYIYESESGELFCHSGKEFFQRQNILSRLEEAANDYDRAEIAEIVKEFLKESCVNHDHSKGRATMVTIDERGFHLFESAHPIEYENPARGYKASDVGEFYPHGYRTP